MKIRNIPQYIQISWNDFLRKKIIMPPKIRKLKNKDFTVIASNCNGAVMCHDFNVRFNTPTVNLSMSAEDYLRLVNNLKFYLEAEIKEKKDTRLNYPVGILGEDITLFFIHYHTFEEAVTKWNKRKKRINWDNMFFMMTDRDGCTEDMIQEFDSLPFANKLIFTSKSYPQYHSAVYCQEFQNDTCVPILTEWRNWKGERLYDRYFDFVSWLNGDC